MSSPKINILIFDRSPVHRNQLRTALANLVEVEVIGTASTSELAARRIQELRPDVVLFELEMETEADHDALKQAQVAGAAVILLVSGRFAPSVHDLKLEAVEFLDKTSGRFQDPDLLSTTLASKLESICQFTDRQREVKTSSTEFKPVLPSEARAEKPSSEWSETPQVVAIGVSTGGPPALLEFLPRLGADFPVPVLIAQHMPGTFTKPFADNLNIHCPLEVCEASEGDAVVAGRVFVAPGGYQTEVTHGDRHPTLTISEGSPKLYCRPSVDVLFASVADYFGASSLGVVLTGMGNDGTLGAQKIQDRGGYVVTQDPDSCVVYGMPRCVKTAGFSNEECSLEQLADRLTELCSVGATGP